MALMDAIRAVSQGLSYSTAAPARPARSSMFAGVGGGNGPAVQFEGGDGTGGIPPPAGGGGGGYGDPTPPRYTQENPDGSKTIYELQNGGAVVLGTIPAPMPSGPTYHETPPIVSRNPRFDVPAGTTLDTPTGPVQTGLDYGTFAGVQALKAAGLLTADEASDMLFGKDGGGGGMTANQAAQLARQAEQDKWNRVLDYIGAAADERQLQASLAAARRNALISAAPDMPGGMDFSGGFGPYGGYTLMEKMQGGPGAARPMAPRLMPLDLGPAPVDPGLVDSLLGPLMGV